MHSIRSEHSFKSMITKELIAYLSEKVWRQIGCFAWSQVVVTWHWVKVEWRVLSCGSVPLRGWTSQTSLILTRSAVCLHLTHIQWNLQYVNFASTFLKLSILSWSASLLTPPSPQLLSSCVQRWRAQSLAEPWVVQWFSSLQRDTGFTSRMPNNRAREILLDRKMAAWTRWGNLWLQKTQLMLFVSNHATFNVAKYWLFAAWDHLWNL